MYIYFYVNCCKSARSLKLFIQFSSVISLITLQRLIRNTKDESGKGTRHSQTWMKMLSMFWISSDRKWGAFSYVKYIPTSNRTIYSIWKVAKLNKKHTNKMSLIRISVPINATFQFQFNSSKHLHKLGRQTSWNYYIISLVIKQ